MVLRKHSDLLWQLLIGPMNLQQIPRFATNTFNMIDFLAVFPGSLQELVGLVGLVGLVWVKVSQGNFPIWALRKNSWSFIEKRCIDKKSQGILRKKTSNKHLTGLFRFHFWNLTFPKKQLISGPPFILTRDPLRYLSLLGVMLRQGDQQQSFAHLGKATCFLKKKKENKMGWFLSDISCSYTFLFKMNFRFLVVCCVVVMPFFREIFRFFFRISPLHWNWGSMLSTRIWNHQNPYWKWWIWQTVDGLLAQEPWDTSKQ